MNSEKPSGFKFRIDEESPESYLQTEMEDQRFRKLSQRVTRIAIFVPILIGLAAGWGYYDLRKGVVHLKNMDVTQVQKLSADLNSKFSSLSLQYAKVGESVANLQESFKNLESSFDKKVLPLDEIFLVFEKTTSALKNDLKIAVKSMEALKASKSDKAELAEAFEKIDKKVGPFNQHLKNMESEIKALDENLTQELAELSGNFHKIQNEVRKFEKIQKDVSELTSGKLDKKGLENELKNQEKRLQQELQQVKQNLKRKEATIETMERQIQELMKFKALSEIKKRLQPIESTSSKKSTSKPSSEKPKATPKPPESKPAAPQPGKIIEENLR